MPAAAAGLIQPVARCSFPRPMRSGVGLFASARPCRHPLRLRQESRRFFTVLGIESSCDDSSVAILHFPKDGKPTLPFHRKVTADTTKYQGINPITAFQSHRRALSPLIHSALPFLPDSKTKPDLVAVTRGPGMVTSLDVGLQTAKGLALAWDVPLVGVNHMQGHALTVRLCRALEGKGVDEPKYPFLSLLVSGGHTMVVVSRSLTDHSVVADTIDTAVGDCLDKIARVVVPEEIVREKKDTNYGRMLEEFVFAGEGGGYGGYQASERDDLGKRLKDQYGWVLPVPLQGHAKERHKTLMKFSFVGIRSSVDRLIKERQQERGDDWATTTEKKALGREAMRRCWEHLTSRTIMALEQSRDHDVDIKTVVVGGGVASNQFLREVLRKQLDFHNFEDVELAFPPIEFCTDNAAMIAWTGYEMYKAGYESTLDIAPFRKWSLQPATEGDINDPHYEWSENAFGILAPSGWKKREAI